MWTHAGIFFVQTLGRNFSESYIFKSYIFIQENAFENVVCEMVAILSRPNCVEVILTYNLSSCRKFVQG